MKRLSLPANALMRARDLRADPTEAEKAMWRILREAFPEARFRRQVPLGRYIADFASHGARIVIECDGGQHSAERDAARTALLGTQGYDVVRFWNDDVLKNPEGVTKRLAKALPPCGGGLGGGPIENPATDTADMHDLSAPTSRPPHKGAEAKRQSAIGATL